MTTQEIKLKEDKIVAKVWNKEKQSWFYLYDTSEECVPSILAGILKNDKGEMYLGCSLSTAPWIWGEMFDMKNDLVNYKLSKADLLEALEDLKNSCDKHSVIEEASELLLRYVCDKDIAEAFASIGE